MPVKTSLLYVTIALLICTPLFAEELTTSRDGADLEASDMELFEFIADWESDDGQWLEPSNFEKKAVQGKESDRGDFHMTTTQEGHYDY